MPPPPVAGAAVGNGPTEGVRVADGRALALRVADGLTLGVLTVAVGLGEMLGDAEVATPGDNFGGAGGDPVQATADAEATMVANPTAVSLALNPVPAVVVCIFMGLLKPAADGGPFRAASQLASRGTATRLARCLRRRMGDPPAAPTEIKRNRRL